MQLLKKEQSVERLKTFDFSVETGFSLYRNPTF